MFCVYDLLLGMYLYYWVVFDLIVIDDYIVGIWVVVLEDVFFLWEKIVGWWGEVLVREVCVVLWGWCKCLDGIYIVEVCLWGK